MMTSRRSRLAATTLVGAFALAACGGSANSDSAGAPSEPAAVQIADDIVLDPAVDVASNQLPDLVVDNLNDDNKVNLRNYGSGDKPILLWMWAPH